MKSASPQPMEDAANNHSGDDDEFPSMILCIMTLLARRRNAPPMRFQITTAQKTGNLGLAAVPHYITRASGIRNLILQSLILSELMMMRIIVICIHQTFFTREIYYRQSR